MLEYLPLSDGRVLRCWRLDFETQSECDLRACGAYAYAEHPTTRPLMIALHTGDQKFFWTPEYMQLWMPDGVEYVWGMDFLREIVEDPEGCVFIAHNMEFERAMWTLCLRLPEPTAWRDTVDVALSKGLPAAAEKAGEYLLGMTKDAEGYKLMMRVCKPDKQGRMPLVTAQVVQGMINYNFRDVDISDGIAEREGVEMCTPEEQRVCDVHHAINGWGVYLDQTFARNLQSLDEFFKTQARERVADVTGGYIKGDHLTRVNWLREEINHQLPSELHLPNMRIQTLTDLMDLKEPEDGSEPDEEIAAQIPDEVIEVIKARLIVSRAALAKVDAAFDMVNSDGRMRGLLRYWGAGTGRWAGYKIQPHNMKRPGAFDLPRAIDAVLALNNDEFAAACWDKKKKRFVAPYELLGSLIRGIFIPAPGSVYVVGDFSAVEARGILWLAGDDEGLKDYFELDANPKLPDMYRRLAAKIYGVTPEEIGEESQERQGGKVGILACIEGHSPVLTKGRGWVEIRMVHPGEKVWDGVEWVSQEGPVYRGQKEVVRLSASVACTRDHKILTPGRETSETGSLIASWISAEDLIPESLGDVIPDRLCGQAVRLGLRSLMAAGYRLPPTIPTHHKAVVDVYDLKNCGPRHRFQCGEFIVHNCGFGGGANAVLRMALGMGIDLMEIGIDPQTIVDGYRQKYPKVVQFWNNCQTGFINAMESHRECNIGRIAFRGKPDRVEMVLPSERVLTYMNPRWTLEPITGRRQLCYDTAVKGRVNTKKIYGGLLSENATQAFCRDCLATNLVRCADNNVPVAFHVHDEIIAEVQESWGPTIQGWLRDCMRTSPAWAQGMPLNTKPKILHRYGK